MTHTTERYEGPVPVGGSLELRVFTVEIANYDDAGSGDGEPLDLDNMGFRRVPIAFATEPTAAAQWAEYDKGNESLRVYDSDGELASDAEETATVRFLGLGW